MVFLILILKQSVIGLIFRTIREESRTLNRTFTTLHFEILKKKVEILNIYISCNLPELFLKTVRNSRIMHVLTVLNVH